MNLLRPLMRRTLVPSDRVVVHSTGDEAKKLQHKKLRRTIFCFAFLAQFSGVVTAGASDAAPSDQERNKLQPATQIAFLHLKLFSDRLEVLSCRVVPGYLKNTPEKAGDRITLEVFSNGKTLWKGWINQPSKQKKEWASSDNHNQIHSFSIVRDTPEVTIRVPVFEPNQTLEISRINVEAKGIDSVKVLGRMRFKNS